MVNTDKRELLLLEATQIERNKRMEKLEQLETIKYYDTKAKYKHPEVEYEWIKRTLANPYYSEVQQHNGRIRYYGYIKEIGKWLRVVIDDGKLLTAHIDKRALKRWGHP